jgi:hypothetical protein
LPLTLRWTSTNVGHRVRAVVAATSVGIAFCAAWACLPDLEISSPAAVCGDGFIDPDAGEECDPGGLDGGDAGGAASACVGCKVACTGTNELEDPATQHCYLQGTTAASDAGIGECEAWGGHLVRIVSENELALVANAAVVAPFWIGIHRTASGMWRPLEETYEPGWAADCAGCFAQADDDTIPDPTVADGTCVTSPKDLSQPWDESLCGALRQTICEREPVGSRARACGANVCLSVAATESSKRYVVIGSPVTNVGALGANDAVIACSAAGGRLVVLGSREEREQLGKELGAYFGGTPSAWIGLSDTDGTWGWDGPDAGGMSPLPWGAGEPALITGDAGTVSVGRAFVALDVTQLDSELAHAANAADGGGAQHAALCEIP